MDIADPQSSAIHSVMISQDSAWKKFDGLQDFLGYKLVTESFKQSKIYRPQKAANNRIIIITKDYGENR